MARRKRSGFMWRALFAVFRGLWWLIKNLFVGLYRLIALIFRRVKKAKWERIIEKRKNSGPQAEFAEAEVKSTVSGNYDTFSKRLDTESLVVLVFGKRGSGKTALGFRILENVHAKTGRKCAALGIAQEILPGWVDALESLDDAAKGSVVLVDEGALAFSSRESMSKGNKSLGKLLAVARHKDLSLIFATQNTGMVDKYVLSLADTLIIKRGSLLQQEMERPQIKKFYDKAEKAFAGLSGDVKKYAYVIDADFEGVVSVTLPSFWSERVSKSRG